MALTFTTGTTLISAADSVTNWAAVRITGSGGAPAAALDTVTFRQGTGSISARMSGANWDAGLFFDWYASSEGGKSANTTVNLTTAGNEVISIWLLCTSPSAILTLQNGGAWIIVSSSADSGTTVPTAYRRWYVSGSDVYPGGWVLLQIDTRKTASVADVGSPNLAAVRRIGVGLKIVASPPTLRSDNLYVDAGWYGRPIYAVKGDGSTVANWAAFLNDAVTNANGLITDVGGAYQLACGIRFGATNQTATTTFTDATGRQLFFKRVTYYYSGVVDALNYSDYYLVEAVGAASYKTSVTIGSVVGTSDERQGVLGGGFRSPDTTNLTFKVDSATGIANLSAFNLYGMDFVGAKGGILLDNDSGATVGNVISVNFVNCGEVDPGATGNGSTILSCSIIDPLGGTAANRGLRMRATHRIKRINFITSGTPSTQHMLHLPDSGTYDLTLDAIKFFGSFTSASLWHGELSNATAATVTGKLTNSANPTAAEFDKTGSGSSSITTDLAVTVAIHVQNAGGTGVSGVQVRVEKQSDGTAIIDKATDGNGDASEGFTYPGSAVNVYIKVRKYGYEQIKSAGIISDTGLTSTQVLTVDPQQV